MYQLFFWVPVQKIEPSKGEHMRANAINLDEVGIQVSGF